MGKSGPKSKHPSGFGHITSEGYHRGYDAVQKRQRMIHVMIWEEANGPIPKGFQVHHKDEDKQNNALNNLEILDTVTHKRLHSGCELRDGEWWKPCHVCGELRPVTLENWYFSDEGWPLYGRCRPCHRRIVSEKAKAKVKVKGD